MCDVILGQIIWSRFRKVGIDKNKNKQKEVCLDAAKIWTSQIDSEKMAKNTIKRFIKKNVTKWVEINGIG